MTIGNSVLKRVVILIKANCKVDEVKNARLCIDNSNSETQGIVIFSIKG